MKNDKIKSIVDNKLAKVVVWDENDEKVLTVEARSLTSLMTLLKDNGYDFLADITAVDYKDKFAVIYQLYTFGGSGNLTVRVELDHENPVVSSLCSIWSAANWLEREVYDLMGITFSGHPNLKRILMWEGYDGHPLRKDYVHVPTKYQGRRELKK